MNQILEKLGIYDLVAVLLSGISITSFTLLADQAFFQSNLAGYLSIDDTLLFLVISYFIGLIFQEFGSLVQKRITFSKKKDKNIVLSLALDTDRKFYQRLTPEEKNGISQIVQEELDLDSAPNDEILYNYCKFYLVSAGSMSRADKDQSAAGMSRSLSLYFFIFSLVITFSAAKNHSFEFEPWAIGMFSLSVLLGYRCFRFTLMRYIQIVRTTYYDSIRIRTQENAKQSKVKT